MKKILTGTALVISAVFILTRCEKDEFSFNPEDSVYLPDTTFLNVLINEGIDANGDSLISFEEAAAVTVLRIDRQEITFLAGIEMFVNLDTLSCQNNKLIDLDVSKNKSLKLLYCGNNELTSLDVSKNTHLGSLSCRNNPLMEIDVSNNTALEYLGCAGCELTALDVVLARRDGGVSIALDRELTGARVQRFVAVELNARLRREGGCHGGAVVDDRNDADIRAAGSGITAAGTGVDRPIIRAGEDGGG